MEQHELVLPPETDGLFAHFLPSSNGTPDLTTAINGPSCYQLSSTGGKTLPAGCARPRSRKQAHPQRSGPATRVKCEKAPNTTERAYIIPRAVFRRIIREFVENTTSTPLHIQQSAVDHLQEVTELYISGVFVRADSIRAINRVATLSKMHIDFVLGEKK